ncbi:MAG: hypothetical protein U5L11_08745 [Arhodomonas sp.]|nr:hypothetical protein [Arhodomonas sp.]
MAFHTPDPELHAVERQNAALRAQTFAQAFRTLGRGLRWLGARLARALGRGGEPAVR